MTISPELRMYAGIEPQSAAVILGNLDHIEIWEPAAYDVHCANGTDELTGDAIATGAQQ